MLFLCFLPAWRYKHETFSPLLGFTLSDLLQRPPPPQKKDETNSLDLVCKIKLNIKKNMAYFFIQNPIYYYFGVLNFFYKILSIKIQIWMLINALNRLNIWKPFQMIEFLRDSCWFQWELHMWNDGQESVLIREPKLCHC